MPRRAPKLDAGDLLAIPLSEGSFAVGQILLPGVSFYLGIDPAPRKNFNDGDAFAPQLFAWTNDAEVWRGIWRKLAERLPVATDYPRPDFKVGIEGKMMVVSFEGQTLRELAPGRDDSLNYRTSFSPGLVQEAAQAINGNGPWLPSFDKMLPSQPQA